MNILKSSKYATECQYETLVMYNMNKQHKRDHCLRQDTQPCNRPNRSLFSLFNVKEKQAIEHEIL